MVAALAQTHLKQVLVEIITQVVCIAELFMEQLKELELITLVLQEIDIQ